MQRFRYLPATKEVANVRVPLACLLSPAPFVIHGVYVVRVHDAGQAGPCLGSTMRAASSNCRT